MARFAWRAFSSGRDARARREDRGAIFRGEAEYGREQADWQEKGRPPPGGRAGVAERSRSGCGRQNRLPMKLMSAQDQVTNRLHGDSRVAGLYHLCCRIVSTPVEATGPTNSGNSATAAFFRGEGSSGSPAGGRARVLAARLLRLQRFGDRSAATRDRRSSPGGESRPRTAPHRYGPWVARAVVQWRARASARSHPEACGSARRGATGGIEAT